ncbi:MAG: DUF1244 domain-containing protein, partial [Gammaproteobacteria bacterium]|nr:DUF1244 domain-containing protein [Gammaproteobacteria bacterium]
MRTSQYSQTNQISDRGPQCLIFQTSTNRTALRLSLHTLFRNLLGHLQKYSEVQNIDIMNLSYFCRNCFSKWYVSEAESHGIEVQL